MIRRAALLTDGPSDEPLAEHLESLCQDRGFELRVQPIVPARFSPDVGRRVEARLAWLREHDPGLDVVFLHRDAEAQGSDRRHKEIRIAVEALSMGPPVVPLVPVRMTEAWLLLDEAAIRRVAGRPSGRRPLNLPRPVDIERVPDPKHLLADCLAEASELSGRRLRPPVAGLVGEVKVWGRFCR